MDNFIGWVILGLGAFIVYSAYHGKPPITYFESIVSRNSG